MLYCAGRYDQWFRGGFAELMNKKARKLGMENTHFCDSTGLHNPDHYSTVKDIAVLMKYCIKMIRFVRLWRPPDILPELQISTRMELLTTVQCLKICLLRQSQVENPRWQDRLYQ